MPITKDKVTKILDLDLAGILPELQADATQAVADFIKEQILADVSQSVSPVTGAIFAALSAKYEAYKETQSSSPIANMELTGAMLDALDAKVQRLGQIEVGWTDPDQAVKAFNHTTGDTVPKRPLIPEPGQNFRPGIVEQIDQILDSYRT